MMRDLERIGKFWQWFVENQGEVASLPKRQMEIYPQIIEAIHGIDPGLVCDLELGDDTQKKTVVVSADGDKVLFPLVMRVVGEAPLDKLPGWRVIAFRQPRGSHFNLQFMDYFISSDQVMVRYKKNKRGKLDVIIFIKDLDSTLPGIEAVGMVLLDNTIGEYYTETRIGMITVKSYIQGKVQWDDWIPLIWLPRVMGELYGKP
jgi:hypothetical protein